MWILFFYNISSSGNGNRTFYLIQKVNKFFLSTLIAVNAKWVLRFKSLKSKKKKLALTLFYYVSREVWLGNSKRLICIDQSRFYIFSHPQEFKNV